MRPYLSPTHLDDKLDELNRLRTKEWRSLRDEDRMAVLIQDIKRAKRYTFVDVPLQNNGGGR